ncbi:maleylacetate reductase [Georgenia sp. Z1491]|uniref:maleylacetate reductase n=1 Tax=Georgenia sp. Z1491 TaxID=3416707 RepID=UPI003CF79D7C
MTSTSSVYVAHAQRVVSGPGAARTALAGEIEAVGGGPVLLVVSERELGIAEAPLAALSAAGVDVAATFPDVRPHVPADAAEAARAVARDHGVRTVVALGGGSTTGLAKAIALTDDVRIVAIPTTYAGSEATVVWGVTENQRKTNGSDPRVLPASIVYDPELTVTLPESLSVTSGLNAMAHCVDSLWAPSESAVSTAYATEGIRALGQGLAPVVADGADLAARGRLQDATYLAAAAFSAAGSGMHHKICHVLGGRFDLEHAALHTVVLPHVLAFNAQAAPDAAARVATSLAVAGYGDGTDAVGALLHLYDALGAPRALADLGLRTEDLDEAAELALEKVPASNPRQVGTEDLRALLGRAQAGEAPRG